MAFKSSATRENFLQNLGEISVDITNATGSSPTNINSTISDLTSTNTLYLDNTYDSENLISVFDSRWADGLSIAIFDAETTGVGISPSKYVINVDGQQNDLIYGEPTSDSFTRPYFSLDNDLQGASVVYGSEEQVTLQAIYEKQNISDSIKEKVSSMSSTILAKINLNIEQDLSFQKTKTKALKFKNTSIFEEAPEVVEATTTTTPTSTATTLSTTSGNY